MMRITGGSARGRRLHTPKGRSLRPTADRVRESLFQILSFRLDRPWEHSRVLDLFAGTGAMGLEALSRGAGEVIFVDVHPSALDLIRRNLALCHGEKQSRVLRGDVRRWSGGLKEHAHEAPFDVVLADPPYGEGLGHTALVHVEREGCLCENGWMVVEEVWDASLPERVPPMNCETSSRLARPLLLLVEKRRYGSTGLWFYQAVSADRTET